MLRNKLVLWTLTLIAVLAAATAGVWVGTNYFSSTPVVSPDIPSPITLPSTAGQPEATASFTLPGVACSANLALADLETIVDDPCYDANTSALTITDITLDNTPHSVIIGSTLAANNIDREIIVYFDGQEVYRDYDANLSLFAARILSPRHLALIFHRGFTRGGDSFIILNQTGTIIGYRQAEGLTVVDTAAAGLVYQTYPSVDYVNEAPDCLNTKASAELYTSFTITVVDDNATISPGEVVTFDQWCQN